MLAEDNSAQESAAPRLVSVDDAIESAELVARVAERCGFVCRHTSKPSDVANLVLDWTPSVIVTDICMPGMDAIELFTSLRQIGFKGDLIIVSGQDQMIRSQAARLAELQGMKVVADLQKPIDFKKFKDQLKLCQQKYTTDVEEVKQVVS